MSITPNVNRIADHSGDIVGSSERELPAGLKFPTCGLPITRAESPTKHAGRIFGLATESPVFPGCLLAYRFPLEFM